jgi:DNA-binding GntR family transcriptional regulator
MIREPINDGDTLSAKVFEALRDEILDGTLTPGTRLVRRDLGVRLGVSPIPVAEALSRLERDGLVESKPRSGAMVRRLSLEGVRNDQILRQALECEAARLSAEHASDAQLQELYRLADTLDGLLAGGDPHSELGMETHLEYHLAVARSSGYEVLAEELRRVWLRRFVQLNWVNAVLHPVPPLWHRQLTDAIATRDPAFANAKMRHHVRFSIDRYLDAVRRVEGGQAPRADGR